jgi:protein-tyrosine phosphatase
LKHFQKVCCSSIFCLQAASALAGDRLLNTPNLSSIDNFRDIAGTSTAYATSNGGILRGGVFYRSNALTPAGTDLALLNSLNISNVFDLRTPGEIADTPDTLPAGSLYTHINILGTANSEGFMPTSAVGAVSLMQDMNRSFVTDNGVRSSFGQLFRELAGSADAALFHCIAGKDRTGWTAAVLQTLAGVDSATVMSDYLATNIYTAERVAATLAQLNNVSPEWAAIYEPLLGVDASYLQAGLDQVVASYGTMDNYLKEGSHYLRATREDGSLRIATR